MSNLLLPTDNCGMCVTEERAITVHPHRVTVDGDGTGVRAWYRCPGCGHRWWTGWAIDALDLPCPGCPACQREAGAA
jgi:hypothetical protein